MAQSDFLGYYCTIFSGESCDGSKWKMFSDIPWIAVLDQCPDMEEENMRNPEWKKGTSFCL